MNITKRALEILDEFPIHRDMPASLSGKYHVGETHKEHLEMTVAVMKHLCREFNIIGSDRDMLIAASYLHDMGLYNITIKGKPSQTGWKYFEATGYSRKNNTMESHPTLGAELLEKYEIPRKKEIQRLLSVHMSHWYPNCPQPETFYDRLVCIADYVASRGEGIFKG